MKGVVTDAHSTVPAMRRDRWAEGLRTIRAVRSEVQSSLEPEILPAAIELPRMKPAKAMTLP
jgi:hypothetical protein